MAAPHHQPSFASTPGPRHPPTKRGLCRSRGSCRDERSHKAPFKLASTKPSLFGRRLGAAACPPCLCQALSHCPDVGLPAQHDERASAGSGEEETCPANHRNSQNVCLKALLSPEMKTRNIVEKTRVCQGKGQPRGRGHAKSSLGLYFPPQTLLQALFDTRKEARVSTCFLLHDKGVKVEDVFQLATLVTLVEGASPSTTEHPESGLQRNLSAVVQSRTNMRDTQSSAHGGKYHKKWVSALF